MNELKKIGLVEIVVIVCIVRIAIYIPSMPDVLALLSAIAAYSYKKYLESKALAETMKSATVFDVLQKQIDALNSQMDSFKDTQAQLTKSADDIKKVISTANLGSAIYKRTPRS